MDRTQHWESVYASRADEELSWIQPDPTTSVALIGEVRTDGRVIDVGGGTSALAERLLAAGYSVTVFNISAAAIARSMANSMARPVC